MAAQAPTPVIILPGIGQSKMIMVDENGNKIKDAWQLDFDVQKFSVLKKPLIRTMLLRRDLGLTDLFASLIRDALDPIATVPDGTMKHRIRVVDYPHSLANSTADEKRYINKMVPCQKVADRIGEDNIYFFAYNSFGEPYKTAAMLDEFIQKVKAEHGVSKVNLLPVSMGGALATAYFDAYGEKNDIKRVIYFVAALNGSAITAGLLNKEIYAENLNGLVRMFASRDKADKLHKAFGLLPKKVGEALIDKILDAVIETALVNAPAFWSIVPSHSYAALREKYLLKPEKAALLEKTDRFYNAQKNYEAIIRRQQAAGTEFFGCVGYGLPLVGISDPLRQTSDMIINLTSTAPGAKTAPLGSFLPADCTGEYISPDRTVDASGALFRDTMWYFAGQDHEGIAENETALEIAANVLSDDNFKNVYSDPAFPRFGKAAEKTD
ncbi:MAG: hypothetical protein IJT27_07095 [Clostridia bacterium]|nr:hypothetical protein [Clostridia bacterium]